MPSPKGVTGGLEAGGFPKGEPELNAKEKYTKFELEQLWKLAGGKVSASETAAAIALAESSGKTKAENHNTNGTIDRGLWQINSIHGAQSTFQVLKNAKAAVNISRNGTDWSPWTTYQNKEYEKYLGPNIPGHKPGEEARGEYSPEKKQREKEEEEEKTNCIELHLPQPIGTEKLCSPLFGVVKDFKKVLEFLGSGAGWTRIAKVVGGGIFIIFAASELAKVGSGNESPNIVSKTAKVGKDVTIGAATAEVGTAVKTTVAERTRKAAEAAKKQTTSEEEE